MDRTSIASCWKGCLAANPMDVSNRCPPGKQTHDAMRPELTISNSSGMIHAASAAYLTLQSRPDAQFWNVDVYRPNHRWGTARYVVFGSRPVPAAYHRHPHQRRRPHSDATTNPNHD